MNRRGFMQAILAAGVAPYVSSMAGVLMPGKGIVVPKTGGAWFFPDDYDWKDFGMPPQHPNCLCDIDELLTKVWKELAAVTGPLGYANVTYDHTLNLKRQIQRAEIECLVPIIYNDLKTT